MRYVLWCWQYARRWWATPQATPSTAWRTLRVGGRVEGPLEGRPALAWHRLVALPSLQAACLYAAQQPGRSIHLHTPPPPAAACTGPLPAGAAIELLSYMCVTPLFYQRLMLHDPSGAAPLRLVLACLTLHDTPIAAPPFARSTDKASSAAASKLVAVQPPYCTGGRGRGDGRMGRCCCSGRSRARLEPGRGCQR